MVQVFETGLGKDYDRSADSFYNSVKAMQWVLCEPVISPIFRCVKRLYIDNLKSVVYLTLAGFAMTLLWAAPWVRPWPVFFRIGSFTALLWNLLWLGNNYLSHVISKKISWTERPVARFAVGMFATVVYTVIVLYAVVLFYEFVLDLRFLGDIRELLWVSLTVTFIVSLFMHSRSFLHNWRTAELTAAQMQFESLKSQVDPHFLFNSLNVLTNLIYEDQEKAARFVKQLSEVYRYVLDTQSKEVVLLSDELKFLRSYLFLQQIRFGDKLKVDIDLPENKRIAPLVLQMLVENAIKHNIMPLSIKIFEENGFIRVENTLRKKNVLPGDSKGIGLDNIRRRYSFLSNQPVEVSNTGDSFIVKLPTL